MSLDEEQNLTNFEALRNLSHFDSKYQEVLNHVRKSSLTGADVPVFCNQVYSYLEAEFAGVKEIINTLLNATEELKKRKEIVKKVDYGGVLSGFVDGYASVSESLLKQVVVSLLKMVELQREQIIRLQKFIEVHEQNGWKETQRNEDLQKVEEAIAALRRLGGYEITRVYKPRLPEPPETSIKEPETTDKLLETGKKLPDVLKEADEVIDDPKKWVEENAPAKRGRGRPSKSKAGVAKPDEEGAFET